MTPFPFMLLIGLLTPQGDTTRPVAAPAAPPKVLLMASRARGPFLNPAVVQERVRSAKPEEWQTLEGGSLLFLDEEGRAFYFDKSLSELAKLALEKSLVDAVLKDPDLLRGRSAGTLSPEAKEVVTRAVSKALVNIAPPEANKGDVSFYVVPSATATLVGRDGSTLRLPVRAPQTMRMSREERAELHRQLNEKPIRSLKEPKDIQASMERATKVYEEGGTTGYDLRVFRFDSSQPRSADAGLASLGLRHLEEHVAKEQARLKASMAQALSSFKDLFPELFAAARAGGEGSRKVGDLPPDLANSLAGQMKESYRQFGFASPEAASRFLQSATVRSVTAGFSIMVAMEPDYTQVQFDILP